MLREVVCFGGLHWDIKARLGTPLRGGTSNPVAVTRSLGGVACNVARTLAALGVPVRLVSLVGDDGGPLLEHARAAGVDVSAVQRSTGVPSASYTAVLQPTGDLAVGLAAMDIYEGLDPTWIEASPVSGDLWFADANVSRDGLIALAARASGRPLLLDPVSVEKSERLQDVIGLAASVFPDELEATALTGADDPADAARALAAGGAGLAVVTAGEAGVWWADGSAAGHRPAVPAPAVADVTGAGDAFAAGYVAGLAHGVGDPIGWGLAAASLAVETIETVPTDLNLERLLARV